MQLTRKHKAILVTVSLIEELLKDGLIESPIFNDGVLTPFGLSLADQLSMEEEFTDMELMLSTRVIIDQMAPKTQVEEGFNLWLLIKDLYHKRLEERNNDG